MKKLMIIVFLCVFLSGCATPYKGDYELTDEHLDFFGMDDKIQLKKFNSSHIDKKYELVIVGNQIIHPPQMGLIEDFAKQGESSVTFLLEKL